jgi:hypothetical protein
MYDGLQVSLTSMHWRLTRAACCSCKHSCTGTSCCTRAVHVLYTCCTCALLAVGLCSSCSDSKAAAGHLAPTCEAAYVYIVGTA